MAIRCRFVDSISATPTVRLDLNAGDNPGFWLGKGGLRCPPPPLKRAESDTMLWDGGTVAASAYGNRELGLPLSFRPGTMDLRNSLVSSLIKELNRETNILEYRPDGSSTSYFFRTFRSPNFDPTMWLPKNPVGMIDVDLYAEPFAYGLRVDQAGVNVVNNPTGTNGMYLDVNGVTGDVETPAMVTLSAGSYSTFPPAPAYLACRRHGTPANLTFRYQAEAATMIPTDTTVQANDVSASGAGSNYVRTTFAFGTLQTARFKVTGLGDSVELRGQYRVLVRCRKTVATDIITVGASCLGITLPSTSTTFSTNTLAWQWLDLGLVTYPIGEYSQNGYAGTDYNLDTSAFGLWISAGRSSGSGSLDYDAVVILPADEDLLVLSASAPWSSNAFVIDGPNDTAYVLNAGNQSSAGSTARSGRIPSLRPGNNRLYFIEATSSSLPSLTAQSTVVVSFWPRYLSV